MPESGGSAPDNRHRAARSRHLCPRPCRRIAPQGGGEGPGRALGLGELKFSGQVLPNVRKIVYNIDIKRVMRSKLVLGIADGWLSADGEIIYRAKDLRVGLFKQSAATLPET